MTDVFTKSSTGWQSGGPAATLVDPGASGEQNALSISGNTVAEGFDTTAAVRGGEDVFVKPAGGWTGSVAPAASLAPPKPGQAVGHGVTAGPVIAADVTPANHFAQRLDAAAVYVKPVAGWSGHVRPSAQLSLPAGSNKFGGLAISSHTIFVSTSKGTYAFNEPARGWSGTIKPSARLPRGLVSATSSAVLISGEVFTRPRHGWVGTIRPVANVVGAPGFVGQAISGTTVIMASIGRVPPGGCVNECKASVAVASKPRNGWSGTHHATTIARPDSGNSLLPVAISGQTLFVTGGGPIAIYQLAGRYGN